MPKGRFPKQRTATSDPFQAQRRAQCVALRKAGLGYVEIAQQLGIGVTTAHQHVKAAIAEIQEDIREDAEQLREIAHQRHEEILRRQWGKVLQGDAKAAEVALKTIQQDAKIVGYAAPDRVEVDVSVVAASIGIVMERVLSVVPEELLPAVQLAIEDGMIDARAAAERSVGLAPVKQVANEAE